MLLQMHLPHLHDQLSVQLLSDECRQLVMEGLCWTVERQSKLESVSPSLPEGVYVKAGLWTGLDWTLGLDFGLYEMQQTKFRHYNNIY